CRTSRSPWTPALVRQLGSDAAFDIACRRCFVLIRARGEAHPDVQAPDAIVIAYVRRSRDLDGMLQLVREIRHAIPRGEVDVDRDAHEARAARRWHERR